MELSAKLNACFRELYDRIDALDVNKNPDDFLMDLIGIIAEEEIEKLKKILGREKFKCEHGDCLDYIPFDIYGVRRLFISNARHDKIICVNCERAHYLSGLYKISNQTYKEKALDALTELFKKDLS